MASKSKPAKKSTTRSKTHSADKPSAFQVEVDQYIDDVMSGRKIVGELERCAVERHLQDLGQAGKASSEYFFDPAAANRVIAFMQLQVHTTGEFDGKPFILLPYQKFVVWCLFGWKRKVDGLRRFRKAYYSIGRGNGKSPFAALLTLVLACYDDPPEPRAEIVIAATERGQTRFVADEIRRMVERQKALRKRFTSYKQRIVYEPNDMVIEQLGKEAKSKDGMNLHAFVADELHEWREEHRGVLDKLQTAMGKRRQPMEIYITTAGSDQSVIWIDIYEDACKVARGIYENDRWFVFICQMDEGDDPFDEAVWSKANPNLDISVKRDYLRGMAQEAEHNAGILNKFLRYHMNVRVRSDVKAIDPKLWAAGTIELPELLNRMCASGLDLGWRDDLASLALCFPMKAKKDFPLGENEQPKYFFRQWSWICAETDKRDLTQQPWAGWIRSGRLIVTPGNTTDPAAIFKQIDIVRKLYDLKSIALDPNNARAPGIHLVNEMGLNVFEFFQTCRKYNEPTQLMLTLLQNGGLQHDGDPLFAWTADNLVLKTDAAGLVMPDKTRSSDKIDPMVAAIMALSECLFLDTDAGGYNTHSFRQL